MRMGRQKSRAKRSLEMVYGEGMGIAPCLELSLGIPIALCGVECCDGK